MNALQLAHDITPVTITRPCVRCELTLVDPASVEAGIGPICRGFANQILAKEVPSAWSDTDLFNFSMLTADSFPTEVQERFAKVFAFICASRGMNQAEAAKGDDMRAIVKELVFLASVAPTNAIYETLIGAIRGIGYVKYAAFVSGDSASGEATVTLEGDNVFLSAVRNSLGQNALYKVGARRNEKRWFVHQSKALDFIPVVSIYWPFAKGVDEVLAALENATKTAQEEPKPAPLLDLFKTREVLVQALCTEPNAVFALEDFDQAHPEVRREIFANAMATLKETTPAVVPAPAPVVKSGELAIDHGQHLTHHRIVKETEKAFQIESDDPFSHKVTSWVPKSWLKETRIKGAFKIIPWALDKLTKYQEAALGIREI